jgi:membrane protease YdiL (CAAX protease family)
MGISLLQVEEAPSALTGLVTSTPVACSATYLAFCVITTVIEEYVYRGFLLASLASHIRWPFAIIVSSLVFAISHLGASGLPSLFMIGCVLGLAYTWTGNLATSLVIHGLYNAIVLTRSVVF